MAFLFQNTRFCLYILITFVLKNEMNIIIIGATSGIGKALFEKYVAEELAHDAFLLAFAKMGQLHDPGRFGAWLKSFTTNVARHYMQRHRQTQK